MMNTNVKAVKALLMLTVALGSVHQANAQSIEMKSQEYIAIPKLPIEKPKTAVPAMQVSDQKIVPPQILQQAGTSTPGLDWRITPTDNTISAALTRWGSQAGYQVVWQAEKDLPAFGAVYSGGFEAVIESLMNDTVHSGYPLHACLYDNKVVRILHITQSCGK